MITKNISSRTLIVHAVENFDALQVDYYRQQLRTLINEGYRYIIFDFQETRYINSSGLGLLVEFYNRMRRLGGTCRVIHCPPMIDELLHQTRLEMLLGETESDEGEQAISEGPKTLSFDRLHDLMSQEILLLSHVSELSQELLTLDDPDEISSRILKRTAQALSARRGALFYLSQNEERLQLAYWIEDGEEREAPEIDLPLKINRLEYQILESQAVTIRTLLDPVDASSQLFRRLEFRSLAAVPISGKLRRYGLLALELDQPDAVVMHTAQSLIEVMATICGLALEKAATMRQLNLKNDELNDAMIRLRKSRKSLVQGGHLAALGTAMAGIGHQLNNKLMPLLGYTQLLETAEDLSPKTRERVAKVVEATEDFQMFVGKLVRIGQLRVGESQPIDLDERLGIALDLLSDQIQRQQIQIDYAPPEEIRETLGDPDLTLRTLLSVLHRSCTSFVGREGDRWIRIRIEPDASTVRVLIEDNGEAPAEVDLEETGDPLVTESQFDEGKLFNYTIPRSLVRQLRGQLTVAPLAETEGKRIVIALPMCDRAK